MLGLLIKAGRLGYIQGHVFNSIDDYGQSQIKYSLMAKKKG